MADELDPILEARLRSALQSEADSVPFTLRADTVRRVGAERRRARNTQRFTMLAAASVVLVAVAGLALTFAMRSPGIVAASPSPASSGALASPNLTGLPSYDELALSAQSKTELARQEGQAGPQGAQWQIGVPQGTRTVEVVVACTGGNLDAGTMGASFAVKFALGAQCNGQPVDLRGIGGGALGSDASPSIVIRVTTGTAFRLIVRDEGGASQNPDAYPAATPDANGLATYDALKHELEAGGDTIASMTGEHPTSETGSELRTWDLGTLNASQGQIAVSCFGPDATVGFGDGTKLLMSIQVVCDPIISMSSLPTNADSGVTPHLMVQALPSVRWRVVAGIVPTTLGPTGSPAPTPSSNPSPQAGLPADSELLAFASPAAVEVGNASGTGQQTSATISGIAHRVSLAIVTACAGGDTATIALVNDQGVETPLGEMGPGVCDGKPAMYAWASTDGPTGATSVKVSYPAGTTWTAILVDTSRVRQDPGGSPLPAGQLPSVSDIENAAGNLGITVASAQQTDGTGGTTAFADFPVAGAVQVRLACVGSGATSVGIANTGGTQDDLGQAICDGTVQSFTWIRSAGVSDATDARISSPAGVTWSAVVSDATGSLAPSAHTTPAVACGTPDLTTKSPPKATLYQGTKAIGTVSAFTTDWSGAASDGIPTTPATAFGASSAPLTIRIAGDVCATSWVVRYAAAGAPGDVLESFVGMLANQQPEAGADVTTTKNRENRIDLAALPSGDWVLEST